MTLRTDKLLQEKDLEGEKVLRWTEVKKENDSPWIYERGKGDLLGIVSWQNGMIEDAEVCRFEWFNPDKRPQ